MLYSMTISNCIMPCYSDPNSWHARIVGYELCSKLKPKDTVCLIFNSHHKAQFDWLCACPDVTILFVGPAAVNKTPGHGTHGRNCLVIFDVNEKVPTV